MPPDHPSSGETKLSVVSGVCGEQHGQPASQVPSACEMGTQVEKKNLKRKHTEKHSVVKAQASIASVPTPQAGVGGVGDRKKLRRKKKSEEVVSPGSSTGEDVLQNSTAAASGRRRDTRSTSRDSTSTNESG